MICCGVDEAGRGPVIGPLVIVGITVEEKDINKLSECGVKDSKLLSPKKREQISKNILKIINNYHIIKLRPSQIDYVVKNGKKLHRLNRLEARTIAKIIEKLKPDQVYVDSPDVIPERFGLHILEDLTYQVNIISKHKADIIYPIVSAASIIAKIERDKAIFNLKKKYGDFGSGYPSDSKTISFLEKLISEEKNLPKIVRKSWKTIQNLKMKFQQ